VIPYDKWSHEHIRGLLTYMRYTNRCILYFTCCAVCSCQVISQARGRFTPNITAIKRCIEMLIEKQYLQRSEDSRDTYNYIA